ncbi:hypothetical protein PV326_001335 [Microctonus aethiopoides]|nr:hypothetical protein PV326_001335 [Microctonus aethiopoides]
MSRPHIEIKHSWQLELKHYSMNIVKPYSASFDDELLPDVKFNISCNVLNDNSYKLILSKTPCRPANATVRILLRYSDRKDHIYDYSWVDDCILECNFSVSDPRCRNCMPKMDQPHFSIYYYTCCITWHGFNEPKPLDGGLYISHLKNFLTVPDLSDAMIIIDEKEFPVHKIILAAYSPVFLAMFKTDMTESANKQIIITDIEVDIMQKVVEFMYSGTINPVPEYDILLSILKVADKYEMKDLKGFCEKNLSDRITFENLFEILEENSLYGGPLLTKRVLHFMVKNKLSIIKLEDFEDFHRKKPELLLKFFIHIITDGNVNECWTTCFGKDADGFRKYQNILKEVDVTIVSNSECHQQRQLMRLGPNFNLHPGFICAGGEEGKDARKGDGGDPMVWHAIGVVSWGIGCRHYGVPGVNSRVSHYLDWIRPVIG